MRVMTSEQEELLSKLVQFAGDPVIVQEALRELNSAAEDPPTVEKILQKIVALKGEREKRAIPAVVGSTTGTRPERK